MSDLGDGVNEFRTDLAIDAAEFLADLCDLIGPPVKVDQGAGHTITDGAIVQNVPCGHEQIGGGGVQVNDNGTVVTKTHRLTLPYTSQTILVDRHYKIKVRARGLNPEVIFEQPVQDLSDTAPLLDVLCVLTEGYRKPGTL